MSNWVVFDIWLPCVRTRGFYTPTLLGFVSRLFSLFLSLLPSTCSSGIVNLLSMKLPFPCFI